MMSTVTTLAFLMMEKLSQLKRKFFKFLPKQPVAYSAAFHQNPPLSPSRSVATSRVSIIPKEARRKHTCASFSAREPSSPEVSCMGQVQCKKKRKAQKQISVQNQQLPTENSDSVIPCHEKKENLLLWIFKGSDDEGPKRSGNGSVLEEKTPPATTQVAPSLGTMKKFTSGRGSLCDFDATLAER